MNRKHLIPTLLVLFGILTATSVFAQADRIGNGGNWSEADLKHCLERLANYLASTEGQVTFPEVRAYDEKHPDETIEKIARELNPRLQNHAVFDSKGNERDCVSHGGKIRFFECNLASLPDKPKEDVKVEAKSEYYGSLYRIVLHEVLVQAELEKPLSKEVPSEYTISSRLMVHLENFPEWVPGAPESEIPVRVVEVYHSKPEWSASFGAGIGGYGVHPITGLNLNLQFPIVVGDELIKFGFSTGFDQLFGSYNVRQIPILGTAEYDFHRLGKFRPYFRGALGISISQQTGTYYMAYNPTTNVWSDLETHTTSAIDAVLRGTIGAKFGSREQYFIEGQVTFTGQMGTSYMLHTGFEF